ncbi:MAG TPA: hypothetical protein VK543_06110 [Puia sp.]|nr:hypothetical protein [Puia sp.]
MPTPSKPNYFWSMLTMKCPRCRRGSMFTNSNPWNLKQMLKMPEKCPVCGQPFELEVGFWYGTGYVSYALTVAMTAASLVAWWLIIGLSTDDNRFFWWLGINSVALIVLQPWIMRLSRVIYLYFFVSYDPNYKDGNVKTFDYKSEGYIREENKSEQK